MKKGDPVMIVNHPNLELNGRFGVLVEFDKDDERWIVKLPEGRTLAKENQLEPVKDNL